MEIIKKSLLPILIVAGVSTNGQNITVKSPDSNIIVTVSNNDKLTWSVTWRSRNIVDPSPMGFELKNEETMTGNLVITGSVT